jgi:hypothetical protein
MERNAFASAVYRVEKENVAFNVMDRSKRAHCRDDYMMLSQTTVWTSTLCKFWESLDVSIARHACHTVQQMSGAKRGQG